MLAHSKLKYSVYLAELLVVMTDRLKIVKIRGRNVHRVHGHKTQALRRRRVSRVSLAPGKRWCCVLDAQGRRPVETQKKLILGQPAHILQWLLSKKVVATPNLSSLTVVNPVLAKYFEHPRLTR